MKQFFQNNIFYGRVNHSNLIILLSLFLNCLLWLMLLWRLEPSTLWIPLHYNIYFGIDWLGSWWQIFLYPFISLIIIVVNSFLSNFFIVKDKVFSLILLYVALLIQLAVLLGLIILLIRYYT